MCEAGKTSAIRGLAARGSASLAIEASRALPASSGNRPPDGAATRRVTVALGRFDALLSRGLTQVLSEDRSLQIVGAGLDRSALEHIVLSRAPQVAVLDESVARAPSVLERLREAQPAPGIMVLAHLPTVAYAMRLLTKGVSCLAKDVSDADILAAVHIVADGRRVFADVDGHLVEQSNPAVASLTPRELDVLEYLSRGKSHAEIADALQLGVETVRTHSAHIRSKLGVRSKRDLIGLPVPGRAGTKIH